MMMMQIYDGGGDDDDDDDDAKKSLTIHWLYDRPGKMVNLHSQRSKVSLMIAYMDLMPLSRRSNFCWYFS